MSGNEGAGLSDTVGSGDRDQDDKKLTTVIIPNYNGQNYLADCLLSLKEQTGRPFDVIVVDNASQDQSVAIVKEIYPDAVLIRMKENTGFCTAVNTGIRRACTPYIILLNNDTKADKNYISKMTEAICSKPEAFSVSAKMLNMKKADEIDDAGDYFCAFGWATARGKGRKASQYMEEKEVFAACGGAAIYKKEVLDKIGLFDENHFAYLEDIDIGYRAKIYGYRNFYTPEGIVYHAGSAASGSRYNQFKISLASKNSMYLLYKNMPFFQILLNLPLLMAGVLIKFCFFLKKGFGVTYAQGISKGIFFCFTKEAKRHKIKFQCKNLGFYCRIQLQLWKNILCILTKK